MGNMMISTVLYINNNRNKRLYEIAALKDIICSLDSVLSRADSYPESTILHGYIERVRVVQKEMENRLSNLGIVFKNP